MRRVKGKRVVRGGPRSCCLGAGRWCSRAFDRRLVLGLSLARHTRLPLRAHLRRDEVLGGQVGLA
jgi:hypothetical protein